MKYSADINSELWEKYKSQEHFLYKSYKKLQVKVKTEKKR